MPVPDFQSIMLPLLQHLSDGKEHSNQELTEAMADYFRLTEDERNELLPSGHQKVFTNRTAWAKANMKMAGLIRSPRRGLSVITSRGLYVLQQNPERIDRSYLKQFQDYVEKIEGGENRSDNDSTKDASETPQEILEEAYRNVREELSANLLAHIKDSSPGFFERLVVDLLVAMGYGGTVRDAGKSIGKAGDEGIDGIIKEDRLGLDVIYVQAKRWENTVHRPEIQKFAGALQDKRARKGVFITTSSFSQGARESAARGDSRIVLIDGEALAGLMIDYGVGVSTTNVYEVKRIDYDYFEEA
jgi:restriction system protein